MDPDTLDPTARTGAEGLPCTGSSSGKESRRWNSEQTQPASPHLSSFKKTKSGKQNHLFSTFFPSLCSLGNLLPPSAGLHSTALHTHPVTPSCLPSESLSSTHSTYTEPGTRTDTDTHTDMDTHIPVEREKGDGAWQ